MFPLVVPSERTFITGSWSCACTSRALVDDDCHDCDRKGAFRETSTCSVTLSLVTSEILLQMEVVDLFQGTSQSARTHQRPSTSVPRFVLHARIDKTKMLLDRSASCPTASSYRFECLSDLTMQLEACCAIRSLSERVLRRHQGAIKLPSIGDDRLPLVGWIPAKCMPP